MDKDQFEPYINALSFDPNGINDGQLGQRLKNILDSTQKTVVRCHGGTELVYGGPMVASLAIMADEGQEPTKLNLGKYEDVNVGGTFPIGEVFTELKDLSKVDGQLMIWGFPNVQRSLEIAKPFPITISGGYLTDIGEDAPPAFREILDIVREGYVPALCAEIITLFSEGEVLIREFGLGVNKHMGRYRPVNDVTAFERQIGMHVSMGKKHTVYGKEGISKRKTRFHIDLFVDLERITCDDTVVWEGDNFII